MYSLACCKFQQAAYLCSIAHACFVASNWEREAEEEPGQVPADVLVGNVINVQCRICRLCRLIEDML